MIWENGQTGEWPVTRLSRFWSCLTYPAHPCTARLAPGRRRRRPQLRLFGVYSVGRPTDLLVLRLEADGRHHERGGADGTEGPVDGMYWWFQTHFWLHEAISKTLKDIHIYSYILYLCSLWHDTKHLYGMNVYYSIFSYCYLYSFILYTSLFGYDLYICTVRSSDPIPSRIETKLGQGIYPNKPFRPSLGARQIQRDCRNLPIMQLF